MKIFETDLAGVFVIENKCFVDPRGQFVKYFNESAFCASGMCRNFKEAYYSVSKKDVIRGMHFQAPPCAYEKLVFVASGRILDVVLDLRAGSKTYGRALGIELSFQNKKSIYIPKGVAHGFLSLEEGSMVVYHVSAEYSPGSDMGIRWNSFGFDWGVEHPILSERDKGFIGLKDFQTVFP